MKALCSKNLNLLFLLLFLVVSFVQNLDSNQVSSEDPKNFKEIIKNIKDQSLIESDKLFAFCFIQKNLEESLRKNSMEERKDIINNINYINNLFQDKIQIKFFYFLNNEIENSFIFLIKNGKIVLEKEIEDIQITLNVHNLIRLLEKGNLDKKIIKKIKSNFKTKKQNIRKENRINLELLEKEAEPKPDDNKNEIFLIKKFCLSFFCAVLTGLFLILILKYSAEWATKSKSAINRYKDKSKDKKINYILEDLRKNFDIIFIS